jgi:hypothetical protein
VHFTAHDGLYRATLTPEDIFIKIEVEGVSNPFHNSDLLFRQPIKLVDHSVYLPRIAAFSLRLLVLRSLRITGGIDLPPQGVRLCGNTALNSRERFSKSRLVP